MYYYDDKSNRELRIGVVLMKKDQRVGVQIHCRPLLDGVRHLQGYVWYIISAHDQAPQSFADFWLSPNLSNQLAVGKNLLRLPKEWQMEALLEAIDDCASLVVALTSHDNHNPALLRLAKLARSKGAELALVDFDGSDDAWKLLPAVQYVGCDTSKVDVATVTRIKDAGVTLIGQGVEDDDRFAKDKARGCVWFEGYFFTQPLISEVGSGVNKASLLRVLAQLNDPKVDLVHLAAVIGQDVALTHQLMGALNSAAMAMPSPVHSLLDAVRFLGTKRLSFWVSVLMLSQLKDSPPALLYTALARARFLESLAEESAFKGKKDAWFLTGLFSTLDAFLHLPMRQAIDGMPLADDITDALTDQVGDMGHALQLAMTLEGVGASVELQFEGMDVCALSMMYVQATGWAYAVWSQ
jgi:EAL and modified HD-GYP domain-containing signal transduction protein